MVEHEEQLSNLTELEIAILDALQEEAVPAKLSRLYSLLFEVRAEIRRITELHSSLILRTPL